MSELAGLIERVEKATGPDREIDRDLWALATGHPVEWASPDVFEPETVVIEERYERGAPGNPVYTLDPFTASIDAALALVERVLPGCAIRMQRNLDLTSHWAELQRREEGGQFNVWNESGNAPTLPLAIILALLRALQAAKPLTGREAAKAIFAPRYDNVVD